MSFKNMMSAFRDTLSNCLRTPTKGARPLFGLKHLTQSWSAKLSGTNGSNTSSLFKFMEKPSKTFRMNHQYRNNLKDHFSEKVEHKLGTIVKSNNNSWRSKMQLVFTQANQQFNALSILFAKQCNQIVALRLRRSAQIANFYSKLGYDRDALRILFQRIGMSFMRHFHKKQNDKSIFMLFSAVAAFNWNERRISDNEVHTTAQEAILFGNHHNSSSVMSIDRDSSMLAGWDKIIDRENMMLYRRTSPDFPDLYEYKVFASFKDVPARAFFQAQWDTDFRRQWDKLVIKLEVMERDPKSGTEVIHWIMYYPRPWYHREYYFLRRSFVDHKNNVMVIINRSSPKLDYSPDRRYVQVDHYTSNMVIKPHGKSFDENGCDFILTYLDDAKYNIPTGVFSWMATTGVPNYVDDAHKAAKKMNELRPGKEIAGHDDFDPNSIPM